MSSAVSLVLALVCLGLWVLLALIYPVGVGVVHLALAAAAALLVRWWALRHRQPAG